MIFYLVEIVTHGSGKTIRRSRVTVDVYGLMTRHVLYPSFVALKHESHLRHLEELERTQFLAPERLGVLQFERLKSMLAHAYDNCPFYAKRFSEFGVRPQMLAQPLDIQKFPILTKKDIQNNWREMIAANIDGSRLVENRTGGSTGKPLLFYVDRERMETRKAATIRHNRWAGYDIGEKAGLVWGTPRDSSSGFEGSVPLRNRLFERVLMLDASSLNETTMENFVRKLNGYRPKVLVGYAHSLHLLASFIEKRNVSGILPRSVIATAEVLHPHEREEMERIFRCRIFNRYGSRETSVIASECDQHTGLHLNAECLLVEIVENNQQVTPGESGEVVITDLLNFGMPLIRYAIEDRAALNPKLCLCGRSLPLLKSVEGRVTDFIITPEGRYVSGAALTVTLLIQIPGISQAQVVQENRSSVTFRFVRGIGYSPATIEVLREKCHASLGKEMQVSVEEVADIPREPSGKYRFSISRLEAHEPTIRST